MAEPFWPADRDNENSRARHDPMGDPWEEEDDEAVEIEFRPVSDEEFVEDITRREEDDYYS